MKKLLIICAALGTLLFAGCKEPPKEQGTLDISENEFSGMAADGEERTFDVVSNTAWSVTGMPEWIGAEPDKGNGNGTVTLTFAANDTESIRSASLTVAAGVINRRITVTQLVAADDLPVIPDAGFRAWLEREGYIEVTNESKGTVEITEAGRQAQEMVIAHPSSTNLVRSVEGLNYFPELQRLDVRELGLTELDVSENVKLRAIIALNNAISSIDVTMLPDLQLLYIQSCNVEELDVTQNPKLISLGIDGNPIIELDLTNNPALRELYCTSCCRYRPGSDDVVASISELDLSNCPNITDLQCGWNPFLTEIDLNGLSKLKKLHTYGCGFTELDTNNNPELENFQAFFTPSLARVDVRNNPKLKWFYLDETAVTSIDLSGNPVLAEFRFCDTDIESIDLSHNPELLTLYCYGSAIQSLDVSGNPRLIELDLASTDITVLDISNNRDLQMLNCLSTKITSLDISMCPEMRRFGWTVRDANIVCDRLDISGCRNLTLLQILTSNYNALQGDTIYLGLDTDEQGLVVSKIKTIIADNIAVQNIYCEDNPTLEMLSVQNCRFARIDLVNNPNMHKLYMNGTDAAGTPTTVNHSGNAADFEVITTPRP